jgi:tRNA uridine 5-carboxymethylaminomethyl modification enzyme
MFTSRSEYRVSLRSDNADLRLTAKGRAVGVVSDERWAELSSTKAELDRGIALLNNFTLPPEHWNLAGFEVRRDGNRRRYVLGTRSPCAFQRLCVAPFISAFDLLHYKGVDMARLGHLVPGLQQFSPRILERLNIEGLYKQHIIRQVSPHLLPATIPRPDVCSRGPRLTRSPCSTAMRTS